MKLTTKTRYALRALVELAIQKSNKAVPLSALAKCQRVKPKYLEQILIKLHRAKLIKGKKGPGGGYLLAQNPKQIKLKDIVSAVGESTAPLQCVENNPDKYCAGITPCLIQPYWFKLKQNIDSFFNTYTLGDICNGSGGIK